MQFEVRCTRRHGKAFPRWQMSAVIAYRGHLIVSDERDSDLNRLSRCAKLIDPNRHKQPQIEMLWDAVLIYSNFEWIVLTGFERIETLAGRRDFAQSWVCSELKR